MLIPYTSISLVAIFSSLVQAHFISPAHTFDRRAELNKCTNTDSKFQNSLDGWVLERGSSAENYEFAPDGGIVMKITAPEKYQRLYDNSTTENRKFLPFIPCIISVYSIHPHHRSALQ